MRFKREEKVLLIGGNLWTFGAGLLGPLFAVFTQQLGGDILSISWVWGAYMIATGICTVIIGHISDSWIAKYPLMIAGYMLNALCTFGYIFVDSVGDLFMVQIGLGLALALAAPPWNALFDKYSGDGKSDGFEWGLASGLASFATGTGILIGGYIVSEFSFDTLFFLMGCVQIAALGVQLRLKRRPK